MSDELRGALEELKSAALSDGAPVIYLHDPETGQPFGAFVRLDVLAPADGQPGGYPVTPVAWDGTHHSHIEGDEDEHD